MPKHDPIKAHQRYLARTPEQQARYYSGTPEQKAARAANYAAHREQRKALMRARYVAKKDEHNAAKILRRQAWKARMYALFAEGCLDCGAPGEHFHHLEPSTKCFAIANGYRYSHARREAELAKCVVLCRPCHIARHKAMV